jgi:hypothetical protein
MKKEYIFLLLLLIASSSYAQRITIKNDTVIASSAPYAIFKKGDGPMRYHINGLNQQPLLELHNSHLEIQGKPTYVITFLNDHRQALFTEQKPFPGFFLTEIIKCKLINNGSIEPTAEKIFISTHPLPDGYTDVEQTINY